MLSAVPATGHRARPGQDQPASGRRTAADDGYHDLVTVFHAVSLFDEVTVAVDRAPRIEVHGEGVTAGARRRANLAWRAVELLAERAGRVPDVALVLRKGIPVAGGMAGGSADAAGALVGLSALWKLDLSRDELSGLAARARQRRHLRAARRHRARHRAGRDRSSRCSRATPQHWVIALHRARARHAVRSTASWTASPRSRRPGPAPAERPVEPVLEAIAGGDPRQLALCLGNDLQPAAISIAPELRRTLRAGSTPARSPGSSRAPGRRARSSARTPTARSTSPPSSPASGCAGRCGSAHGPGAGRPARRRPTNPRPSRGPRCAPDGRAQNLVNLETVTAHVPGDASRVLLDARLARRGARATGSASSGSTAAARPRCSTSSPVAASRPTRAGQPGGRAADLAHLAQGDDLPAGSAGPRRRAHPVRRRARVGGRSEGARRAGRAGPARPRPHRRRAVRWREAPRRAGRRVARRPRPGRARRAHQPPRRRGHRLARRSTSPRGAARSSSSRTTGGSSTRCAPAPGRWRAGASRLPRRLRGLGLRPGRARRGRPTPPRPAGRTSPARSWPGCAADRPRARPSRGTASRRPRR